jgi:general secretion pathway protein G
MKTNKNKKRNNAFSLVELMAVLLIIGLLAAVAMKNFMGTTDKAAVTATRANLAILSEAVMMFKLDTGRYPAEELGLLELLEEPTDVEGWQPGGYLKTTEIPLDAWNYEFIYLLNPESGKPFVIISYGADGEEGGEDYNADLHSTDAN